MRLRLDHIRNRVLFVAHDASRTGAPLMLLHLLRWLRVHSHLDFSVVVLAPGELLPDFRDVAPTTLVQNPLSTTRAGLRTIRRIGWADEGNRPSPEEMSSVERAFRFTARHLAVHELHYRALRRFQPDLVYINSVWAGSALSAVSEKTRVLTHVHELAFQLRVVCHYFPTGFSHVLTRTHDYIAASAGIADVLCRDYGVAREHVAVCHPFIPPADVVSHPRCGRAIREKLGLPEEALLVGSVGTIHWQKGPDLFIQVAKRVLETYPQPANVVFVWVGPPEDHFWGETARHDVESLGLAEHIRFVGPVADPTPILEALDVFVLTSRSEAFALAALEAAAQRKPVLSFDAGGMADFLDPRESLLVPYLDVYGMAARIVELLQSSEERDALGARLAARVHERHRLDTAAPLVLAQIERALITPPSS